MKCVNCDAEMELGERFCGNCGAERKVAAVFIETEKKFLQLTKSKQQGEIGEADFDAALEKLVIEDGGVYWMIGADSGEWYRHDGEEWVRAEPPQPQPAQQTLSMRKQAQAAQPVQPEVSPPVPPRVKKKSQFPWMLVGIGGGLIGITILVVVIFLAGNIRKYFENASISIDEPDEGFEMETLPAGEPTEFIISPTQTAGIIPTNQVEIPTSNPATAETASYKNIFAHDFNDKEGIEGWEDMPAAESYHGEIDPENSTFQIFIDKPNTMAYFSFGESIMPRTSRDILLTAVFLPPVSSEGEFGLLCRVNKDLGGYYVGVVPLLNQYSMGRFYLNGGGQDALRSNGPNISAYPFTQGDINSMTLWCIGNQIMFSLNGNVIDEFRDTTFDSGTAALYAYLKDSPSGQRYWTTFDFVMIDIPAY